MSGFVKVDEHLNQKNTTGIHVCNVYDNTKAQSSVTASIFLKWQFYMSFNLVLSYLPYRPSPAACAAAVWAAFASSSRTEWCLLSDSTCRWQKTWESHWRSRVIRMVIKTMSVHVCKDRNWVFIAHWLSLLQVMDGDETLIHNGSDYLTFLLLLSAQNSAPLEKLLSQLLQENDDTSTNKKKKEPLLIAPFQLLPRSSHRFYFYSIYFLHYYFLYCTENKTNEQQTTEQGRKNKASINAALY